MTTNGESLIGKTVASVEISDGEVLLTFTDNSEIAMTLETTGGDYGTPYISTVVTEHKDTE